MTNDAQLPSSARRVQEFLTRRGYAFTVRELPGTTRTAREAADSVGCSVAQIAKSLVFKNGANNDMEIVARISRYGIRSAPAAQADACAAYPCSRNRVR
jgi:prolyl-tRNA editing enzyme YbaK/EbsC (Cys-tRNA(Pro) deacylase)